MPRRFFGLQGRCRGCGNVQRIVGPESPPGEPGAYEIAPAEREPEIGEATPKAKARRWREPNWSALLCAGVVEPSRVQGFAGLLVILSGADLFMTYTLLRASPTFFESNPVAQWFFARWNMAGMVAFKFSIIAGVIALAELIERRRPGRGKFVLMVGCLGAVYAVIVGLRLYLGHGAAPAGGGD